MTIIIILILIQKCGNIPLLPMLRFDPVSIREWHRKSITDISCATTDRGCAGKKIQVFEYRDPTFDTPMSI